MIIKILKIAFLYVGTIIGAGFATGKELTAYFNGVNIFTMIFAGIVLGLFAGYYLYLGKIFKEDLSVVAFGKYSKVFDILVFVSVFFVFVSMFDTSDIIIFDMFNIKYGGYFTILATLLVAIIGISFIKKVNALVIPAIVIMIIVIFAKQPTATIVGKTTVFSPILYAGMNIMLAGYIIKPEGKHLTNNEITLITIVTSIVFSIIMSMLYEIVKCSDDIMPLFSIAKLYNLHIVAGMIIYFAIITTALSTECVLIDYINLYIKNKYIIGLVLFLSAIPFKIYVGFEDIVDFIYPIVSILGLLVTIFSFIRIIMQKKIKKQNKKV